MTASSKRRQASMNLNLNWRRKTATPRCRNTNRKPRANCRSICLRRTCSLACTRSLSTRLDAGVLPGTVRLYPSFFRTEKGISENDLVKVFNGTGEVELRAKVTTNVPEDFLVMYEAGSRNGSTTCKTSWLIRLLIWG